MLLLEGSVRDEGRRNEMLKKLLKFLVVGSAGVVVNSLALILLYQVVRLPLLIASATAVELAIAHNFFLNNRWTFNQKGLSLMRFLKFNAVSLVGLLITVSAVFVLVTYAGLHYLVANIAGISLATLWNFGLNLLWTWGWSE